MFRVIIAGTRTFDDWVLLRETMDYYLKDIRDEIVIVSGGAKGADELGEKYARYRGYKIHRYPANWKLHGKAAGPIRNREMAWNADALVAFWDGVSPGTQNMIETAKIRRLKVRVKMYGNEQER